MRNSTKAIWSFLAFSILTASCSSTTLIQSTPSGADVYINNQRKGTTPYTYSDTKVVGSTTAITLRKEGYEELHVILKRNEEADIGAIVAGVFFWFPFLWTMKYDPDRNYELTAISSQQKTNVNATNSSQASNSTNELIKLKNLLDQHSITNDDFTTLKIKILNNQYDYNNSIADQITKLKSLLDSNLLKKDEYNSQKSKLINGK